ncbi:MAG TPA: NADH-quinone oxidoreductase subunit J [Candidatus Polarisedimenticolia bacterium]|nr:NADH-quinone oxidoreductase subunit J [Candidatus Polarisedimenticolia bacterium]
MVVRLLLGLILIVVAFAVIRALAPARTVLAGAVLGAGAVVLVALNPGALASVEFWAGLVGFAAILSALMIVIHPNPMVSVLFLIVNLFCVALFYLILNAQFLAVLQVIIYAGAIMVLFLFVVMLLNLKAEEGLRAGGGPQRYGAIVLGGLFAGLLFDAIRHRGPQPYFDPGTFDSGFGTARDLGRLLFTHYLFAFEAASLLLIAAMIGAVILAKRRLR